MYHRPSGSRGGPGPAGRCASGHQSHDPALRPRRRHDQGIAQGASSREEEAAAGGERIVSTACVGCLLAVGVPETSPQGASEDPKRLQQPELGHRHFDGQLWDRA